MRDALAARLVALLLGLDVRSTGQEASNRLAVEGLSWSPQAGGGIALAVRKVEAASLWLAAGPLVLEVGRLALHQLAAQVHMDDGRPRLTSLAAAGAELADVKVHGPVGFLAQAGADLHDAMAAAGESATGAWSLGPFAGADGRIKAKIVDAHLIFDSDVTVPIRQGRINFNEATVEHVGPDSRMGVSRLGVYVDAPNGRSYIYQFSNSPVAGVEFERRGSLLGARVTDRGHLRLQEFGEGLMRQAPAAATQGVTAQSRLLLDRTALSGDVQLGDGRFGAPGVQADFTGRAAGRNAIRLHSVAVGRGLSADMASLSLRDAVLSAMGLRVACSEITGALTMRLSVQGTQLRFALELASVKMSALQMQQADAASA
ncbi:MAG TPA: hypothetical protein VHL79_12635 [Ramlibacter sp.]|jgi:hypothetical protein|nr:hypothetical protein [Ramlibacter sp.]